STYTQTYDQIVSVSDVDGDGADDVILGGFANRGGATESWAALFTARGGRISLARDFGRVSLIPDCVDTAGSPRDQDQLGTLLIKPKSGGFQILRKNYKRACVGGGGTRDQPFKLTSTNKPL